MAGRPAAGRRYRGRGSLRQPSRTERKGRRCITLPGHVQADKIEATAHDGVFQVTVPKGQEARAKRIQVRAGKSKGPRR